MVNQVKTYGLPVPPLHSFTYVTLLSEASVVEINQQIYIQLESIVGAYLRNGEKLVNLNLSHR